MITMQVKNDTTLVILCENAVESVFFKLESIDEVKQYLLKNYPDGCISNISKKEIMKMISDKY